MRSAAPDRTTRPARAPHPAHPAPPKRLATWHPAHPAPLRRLAAAGVTGVVALALALAGATPASAAQGGSWGEFQVSGSARAYSGSMSLAGGFPATTFTSTSRQATIPSGASTWQAPATPPGARYGSSKGLPYLNQRPSEDRPTAAGAAVTTYVFESPTPSAGWSFVLGDIDADQATITATDASGAAVASTDLGFEGVYNYCRQPGGPSCDSAAVGDVPRWDAATGTLTGNTAGSDTEGAAGWFSPSVPLSSLTITFQQRVGFPVYQTWFATRTFAASGTATVGEGAGALPYAGATVTVTDASGRVVAVTETRADGSYSVPALTAAPGYSVTIAPPAGAGDPGALGFSLVDGDGTGLDFVFPATAAAPETTTANGIITDSTGAPAADRALSIIAEGATEPSDRTTTDAEGRYEFPGLDPEKLYSLIDDASGNSTEFVTPDGLGNRVLAPEPETVAVTGTIVGPDGAPAGGQTVDFIPVPTDPGLPPGRQPTGPDASIVTDGGGGFVADGLAPGTDYVAVVDDDAENPIEFTTPEVGEPNPPLSLAVPAPAEIAVDGTVVDSDGAAAPGVAVEVLPAGSDVPVETTATDAGGRFVFEGLLPGTTYRLVIDGIAEVTSFTLYEDSGLGLFALPADEAPPTEPPVVPVPGYPGTPSPGQNGPAGQGGPGTPGSELAATGRGGDPTLLLGGTLLLAAGLAVAAGGSARSRKGLRT